MRHDLRLRPGRAACRRRSTTRRRSSVARPRTSASWPVTSGCRSRPASSITTAACRDVPGHRLAGRSRRRAPRADGRARGRGRAALRRRGGPAARQRPVRGARVDARDDGHDPEPGAERRDDARAWPGRRRRRVRRASCRERFVASFRSIVGVADVPEDPWLQLRSAIEAVFRSWNSDRAQAYRRKEGIPDDLGHRRHGPGDGLRQPRSGFGHRRPVHAQPGDRGADAVRRRPVRRAGRGRRGRHASNGADRRSRRAHAGGRRRAARSRRTAGAALRRPVRHRVHDRGRPAVDAPGPGRQAQPAGGAADGRRHGRGRGVPAVAGGGGRAGRVAARRPARGRDGSTRRGAGR